MAEIKHGGRRVELNKDGKTVSLTYVGTYADMIALQGNPPDGQFSSYGRLSASIVTQQAGMIWECEFRYESEIHGDMSTPPPDGYGAKSARLRGSMLQLPLENHPKYRACWNHFLAAAPGNNQVPPGWATATDTILSESDSKIFAWIKSRSELPNKNGVYWRVLAEPTKPGVSHYEVAIYSQTETARFASYPEACRMCVNKLNKIGAPYNNPGISGGNWKCDDVEVAWNGKDWLANLTWSRSGNADGWDKDLYES